MRSLCRPRAAEEAGRRRPGSVAQSGGSRPSPAHLGKEQVGGAALTPPQHPAVTATEGQHSPHSPSLAPPVALGIPMRQARPGN